MGPAAWYNSIIKERQMRINESQLRQIIREELSEMTDTRRHTAGASSNRQRSQMIPNNLILRGTGQLLGTFMPDEMADFLRPRRLILVGVGEGPYDFLVDYET
jgi:hypothetical protein